MNFTISTIFGYISEISKVLTEMSEGNLVVGITGEYLGDFVEIKNSLNMIIKSFNEVLGDLNSAAEQVAAGSKQVSGSSQALSQGSTEQASSIEELTASMTQIAVQTKNNAVNANQANELAIAAKTNAAQGNEQMKEMLKAMTEINDSSSNISKIIKVIDEIAFQTNILALNAAVEAARAGQHGKGFAVVAEEVRNLAARSASAAKETTALIEGSIRKVEYGTKIANETAGALNHIVEGVTKAADLVGNIAVASNEQATGIAQANQGISQVSMVTQTNSATAEEGAAASEELSSQAELLKNMVTKFKLKRSASTIDSIEDLSPDILKLIESVAQKKRAGSPKAINKEGRGETAAAKPKIALSDHDFGKY
jgi:methyl-accepting chemotaxis protein